jgi:DNA-directed RNA polymerase specialized sigma24 family protein
LVRDCLARVLDRLHIRRNVAEVRPWLFAIMHNLYVSRVRRRRTREKNEPPKIGEDDLHAYIDGQLPVN